MRYNIGIDLGGTIIKVGLMREGEMIGFKTLPTVSRKGLRINLPFIEEAIEQLLIESDVDTRELGSIGLAFPGIVNPVSRTVISANEKYDDAQEIDLPGWVENR